MPGFNPENINIHDLTIEEPEEKQEAVFDPERDITKEDWQKMKEKLERLRDSGHWSLFAKTAAEMKTLDPSLDIPLDEKTWEGIEDDLRDTREDVFEKKEPDMAPYWGFFIRAMRIKTLDPSRDIYPELNKIELKESKKELKELGRSGTAIAFGRLAIPIKALGAKVDISQYEAPWHRMLEELNYYRKSKIGYGSQDFIQQDFIELATYMKILHPEKVHELMIGEDEWEKMKTLLEKIRTVKENNQGLPPPRKEARMTFSELAMAMKILAAEEVKITESGLKITMPEKKEDLENKILPLPERRDF